MGAAPPGGRRGGGGAGGLMAVTILSVVLAAAGLCTGCQTWTGPRPVETENGPGARTAYIATVDRLCFAADQELSVLGPTPKNDARHYATYLDQVREVYRQLLAKWDTMAPPRTDTDQIRRVLDDIETMTGLLREEATAVRTKHRTEALKQRARLQTIAATVRYATRHYGFRDCVHLFKA